MSWARRTTRRAYRPQLEGLEGRAVPSAGQLNAHYRMTPTAGTLGEDAVAVGPGGKVVMAGVDATGSDYVILRLLQDGTRDPSFGQNGEVDIPASQFGLSPFNFGVGGVAVSADGTKIVVGGAASYDPVNDIFLPLQFTALRLNGNGRLDKTFGAGGFAVDTGTTGLLQFSGIALSPSGQVYLAGEDQGPFIPTDDEFDGFGPTRLDVVRFTPGGQPDTTFAPGGVALVALAGMGSMVPTSFLDPTLPPQVFIPDSFVSTGGNGVALTPAGNIVVVGAAQHVVLGAYGAASTSNFAAVELTPAGQLNPGFGAGGPMPGVVTFGDGSGLDAASGVAVTSSGQLIVAGEAPTDTGMGFAVARLNADGSLDENFAGGGLTVLGGANLLPTVNVALSGSGQILLAGTAFDPTTGLADFAVARLNRNGTPDLTFGAAQAEYPAEELTSFGSFAEAAVSGIVVLPNGQIVVGGTELSIDFSTFTINFDIIALDYTPR